MNVKVMGSEGSEVVIISGWLLELELKRGHDGQWMWELLHGGDTFDKATVGHEILRDAVDGAGVDLMVLVAEVNEMLGFLGSLMQMFGSAGQQKKGEL